MKSFLVVNGDILIAFKNMIALSVMQVVTYLLPLITVPYLLHTIGFEKFGILAFAASLTAYFAILTDYGFNLSASGRIAVKQDDIGEINEIFNAVLAVKLVLVVLSYIILNILLLFFEKMGQHAMLYHIAFLGIVGQALSPIWLYQGLEKLQLVTYINIVVRAIFTLLLFVLVQNEDDYMLVAFVTSGSSLAVGGFSLFFAVIRLSVSFKFPKLSHMIDQFKAGWYVFTSTVAISAYTTSALIIVGIFGDNATVGMFATVEKVITAIKGLTSPLTQAVYPTLKKRISNDRKSGIRTSLKICFFASSVMFFCCAIIFLFSTEFIKIVTGQQHTLIDTMLRIMIFVPVLTLISNFLGVQTLLNLGYEKDFSIILIVTSIIGLVTIISFGYSWGAVGISFGVLLSEALVVILMVMVLFKGKKLDQAF